MLEQQKAYRPIGFVGNLQGRGEVAISISHLRCVTSGRGGRHVVSPSARRHPCAVTGRRRYAT
jgi:hypothetical protein